MNTTISNLRSMGKWYIVPDGDSWGDSLKETAAGLCACGHPIEHSYFACLVVDGEVRQTVEVGSTCVIELTHGYVYRQPSDWTCLTDDQMINLFWISHKVGRVGKLYPFVKDPDMINRITDKETNHFYASLYDFALAQYIKTGFARLTDKQFSIISDKIR
jgi:hypothetical protein